MKGLSANAIHNELFSVLGEDAVAYSTVRKYVRSSSFTTVPDEEENESKTPNSIIVDHTILQVLGDEPFSSVRQIAYRTRIPKTTVYNHLVHSLGYTVKHLRWVPHTLSLLQKQKRVEKSKALLELLFSMKHQSWKYIVTLDESWFYLSTGYEMI
jgi:hypothetical protein